MNTFRLLNEEDGRVWYRILHESYQSLANMGISFEAITAQEEKALKWLRDNPTYGLFDEGELVASATLRMPWGPQPGPRPVPHIGWIVTRPEKKHQGYSRKLLAKLEEEVLKKQLKLPYVTLGTALEHPWLADYYRSLGFKVFDTVQLPDKKHHTLFLKKDLK
ncbi:MAG: GNAT family N-acetyltransferase [Clostridiales bacterium]|nr:GNAT family N-acetyltransferase [Clostridiales bacterium]